VAASGSDGPTPRAPWGAEAGRLADPRAGLRERLRASPLCDGRGFTGGLEATYRTLWRRWCAWGRRLAGPP
jgi:hypothetical protein